MKNDNKTTKLIEILKDNDNNVYQAIKEKFLKKDYNNLIIDKYDNFLKVSINNNRTGFEGIINIKFDKDDKIHSEVSCGKILCVKTFSEFFANIEKEINEIVSKI